MSVLGQRLKPRPALRGLQETVLRLPVGGERGKGKPGIVAPLRLHPCPCQGWPRQLGEAAARVKG